MVLTNLKFDRGSNLKFDCGTCQKKNKKSWEKKNEEEEWKYCKETAHAELKTAGTTINSQVDLTARQSARRR